MKRNAVGSEEWSRCTTPGVGSLRGLGTLGRRPQAGKPKSLPVNRSARKRPRQSRVLPVVPLAAGGGGLAGLCLGLGLRQMMDAPLDHMAGPVAIAGGGALALAALLVSRTLRRGRASRRGCRTECGSSSTPVLLSGPSGGRRVVATGALAVHPSGSGARDAPPGPDRRCALRGVRAVRARESERAGAERVGVRLNRRAAELSGSRADAAIENAALASAGTSAARARPGQSRVQVGGNGPPRR